MSDKYEMKDLGAEAAKARELLLNGEAFKTDTSVPDMPRTNQSRTHIDTEALSQGRVDILQSVINEVDRRLAEYILKALREHGEIVVRLEQDAEAVRENLLLATLTTSIKVAPMKDVAGFLNQVAQILQWHKDACPAPDISDIYTADGCLIEEMAECLSAMQYGELAGRLHPYATLAYETAEKLKTLKDYDEYFVTAGAALDHTDRKAHCDALCDLIVVALQSGYRSGYDMVGALGEVIASNESKRLLDGTFPRNDAGKIIKTSPTYFEADVTPFLGDSK